MNEELMCSDHNKGARGVEEISAAVSNHMLPWTTTPSPPTPPSAPASSQCSFTIKSMPATKSVNCPSERGALCAMR